MGQKSKNKSYARTSTAALQNAVADLEQFSSKNASAPIVNVANLSVKEGKLVAVTLSPFRKTWDLARCFIASIFSRRTRAKHLETRAQVQEVVLQAIDVVKRNHIFIEKLKAGSPEDQQLAHNTLEVIKRYNAVMERAEAKTPAWGERLACFFYHHSGLTIDEELKTNRIDLPRTFSIHPDHQNGQPQASSNKISLAFQSHVSTPLPSLKYTGFTAVTLTRMMADPLSKQEADLLRMKASTLLRQNGIRFKSMSDLLKAINEAPIITTLENPSVASLRLLLTLIPGMTIEIRGAFKRTFPQVGKLLTQVGKTVLQPQDGHSIPILESFSLILPEAHRGFPHAAQYAGWALGERLVPLYPYRLDQIPLFKSLYERKQMVMQGLLLDGPLFAQAKDLWLRKKLAFEKSASPLISLHKQLCMTMWKAGQQQSISSEDKEALLCFFDQLETHPQPYVYLTSTYQALNDHFIARPYAKLHDTWMTNQGQFHESVSDFVQGVLDEEYRESNHSLQESLKQVANENEWEKRALAFICVMGRLLAKPLQAILLQSMSETFGCSPPMLTDFEQKLQAAAYKQLITFLDELDTGLTTCSTDEKMNAYLQDCLKTDIVLFEAPTCDALETPYTNLVSDLEVYFNSRYYSSLK